MVFGGGWDKTTTKHFVDYASSWCMYDDQKIRDAQYIGNWLILYIGSMTIHSFIHFFSTWSHDENVPLGTFSQNAKYVPISTYHYSFQQKWTLEAVKQWAFSLFSCSHCKNCFSYLNFFVLFPAPKKLLSCFQKKTSQIEVNFCLEQAK